MAYENDWSIKSKTPRYSIGKIKNWVGMTDEDASSFAGLFVWRHDGHVYYSRNSHHYELNQSTGEWEPKTWVGLPTDTTSYPFNGTDVWHHNGETYWSYFTTINNYSSTRHICRHLNKNTGEWEASGIQGIHTYVGGGYVWTDGTNTYSSLTYTHRTSSSIEQPKVHAEFKYNSDSGYWYWDTKTWNLSDSYEFTVGYNVWTDGNETYLTDSSSRTNAEYVLNEITGNWDVKTWIRPWYAKTGAAGRDIWSDGIYTYYSYRGENYILDSGNSEWLFTELPFSIQYGRYIWKHNGHVYYSYNGVSLELEQVDYPDNNKVPYRTNCVECIESIDASVKWLSNKNTENQNDWVPVSFNDENSDGTITPSSFDGTEVWSDGVNTYRTSSGTSSGINFNKNRVFDKATGTWLFKDWSSYRIGTTLGMWSDGRNIHYAYGNQSYDYVYDPITDKWFDDLFSIYIYGYRVWTDGEHVYYSSGSTHYELGGSNYRTKTWSGLSNFDGQYVWNYKGNTYYSEGNSQYRLNKDSSYWSSVRWNGLSSFYAKYIWTDGEDYYYSYGSQQYVLNQETDTWVQKTWTGLHSNTFDGNTVWSDGEDYYIGNAYKLNKITKTPYRIDHPQTRETVPIPEVWIIDNDSPYRLNFPELKESVNLHEVWVTELDPDAPKSDITFDPNYRYVKLEFDVNITADNDNSPFLQATTDLPNPYMQVSRGYYWYQWSITLMPATSVASRLYAAEESATNISDFMTHADTYGSSVEARSGYPAIDLAMSPKKLQYTSIGDLDITGSIYSTVTNTSQYNDKRLDEYYRSYVGYTIYLNQTATGSSSSTVTVKLYYCFDQDESGYDALLAEYPNHASPYNPEPPTKVPYRLDFHELHKSLPGGDIWFIDDEYPYRVDFPELHKSLPGGDIWLIDDEYPYRVDFPTLKESSGAFTGWLQNTGYSPYRPWPNHRTIFQSAEPIEIPEIDWTKGMQQTFEYFKVNPSTWNDYEQITTVISSNITKDTDSEMRGHASIETTEPLDECYIRTYMAVRQNGIKQRICLGTHLYMVQSDSFNGMNHQYNYTGYTPLVELREKLIPLGYSVTGVTGEINGKVAPMLSDEIATLIRQNSRVKLENRVKVEEPLLNNFVAGTTDNILTVVNNLLNASSLQQYQVTVDEFGTVCIKEAISVYNERHVFEYTDDNSSILMADIDLASDLSSIPNVLEVIYAGDANKDIGAVRVVVRNEDPNSIVSTVSRGREVWNRVVISNIGSPYDKSEITRQVVVDQVTNQAYRLLEDASTIRKTIQYEHGYCDVEVGDTVLFNYKRAGLIGIKAKVVSQTITCKPGCKVSEMAVYTKKLWNRGV